MARLFGVDLPRHERVEIGLTRIYGIGRSLSKKVLDESEISYDTRVKDLRDDEVLKIRTVIDRDYTVEGDLRKEVSMNVKRLRDIGCYRGLRHKLGLPVRGQRTSTNARTRKGPKKTVSGKKGG